MSSAVSLASFAVGIMVVGLAIGFGAFIFGAVNIFRGITNKSPSFDFGGMLKQHMSAVVAMAFGGLLFGLGLVLLIVNLTGRAGQ